jgi:hypothetical protein
MRTLQRKLGAGRKDVPVHAAPLWRLEAARLTMPLTARSVSRPPPLRLGNTGSLAPASPRSDRSERLTTWGNKTWRTRPPLPVTESCTRSPRDSASAQVSATAAPRDCGQGS